MRDCLCCSHPPVTLIKSSSSDGGLVGIVASIQPAFVVAVVVVVGAILSARNRRSFRSRKESTDEFGKSEC